MNLTNYVMLFAAALGAQSAIAADEENGKRLAQQHCSPCHVVEPARGESWQTRHLLR